MSARAAGTGNGLQSEVCARTAGMEDGKCFGHECYRLTFFLAAGLTLFGAGLALTLARRMRFFYRAAVDDGYTLYEGA